MDAVVGLRVVRGPDWNADEGSDGAGVAGQLGTVVEVGGRQSSSLPEKLVWVQWDTGIRRDHRVGYYDSYDLSVFDSAPAGIQHQDVKCRACQKLPIPGIRWHCLTCKSSYDLCTSCYMADEHDKDHEFERINRSGENGTSIGKRRGTKRIQARGTFPGAIVERGPDWKYGDQDGGKGGEGMVKKIANWKHVQRSAVIVSWNGARKGSYRLGFSGKIDVICTSEGVGGCYYNDHLPTLVQPKNTPQDDDPSLPREGMILPTSKLESSEVKKKGSPLRKIHESQKHTASLAHQRDSFRAGDIVKVTEDKEAMKILQGGQTEESVYDCLGKTCRVVSVREAGDIELVVDGQEHAFFLDPAALSHVQSGSKSAVKKDRGVIASPKQDKHKVSRSESVESVNDTGEILVTAATEGNLKAVQDILDRAIYLIDYKSSGQTALQQACMSGHAEVVSLLIQLGADIHAQDEQGFTALHHAAYGDFKAMTAKFLLAYRARLDDNRNPTKTTPLHLAVERHNHECANVLIQKGCNVNVQNVKGGTPLHEAVRTGDIAMLNLVLSSGTVDLHVCNNKGLNPFHLAVKNRFKVAVEMMLACSPDIVTSPDKSGVTPLEYAVLNNDEETGKLLLRTGLYGAPASNGKSAADSAISRPSSSLHKILQKGADTSLTKASQIPTDLSLYTRPPAMRKVFHPGDRVWLTTERIAKSMVFLSDTMRLTVNKVGTVVEIYDDGRVLTYIEELANYYWFSPSLLELVDKKDDKHLTESSHDMQYVLKILIALNCEKPLLEPPGNLSDHPSTTFFRAVSMCHKSSIGNVLDVYPHGIILAMEGGTGLTGLHVASKVGAVGSAEALLERGSCLDVKDDLGLTPLHYAAIGDRRGKVAEMLLNFGAIVNDKANSCSATPLYLAVLCSNEAAIKVLLQLGGDVNVQCIEGNTALHEAVQADKDSIVKTLILSTEINVKLKNDEGVNPFHLAVLNGNESIVRKLLNKSPELADVRTADKNKMMPLHLACLKCHSGVADILLDTGMCDIHARGCDNRTALAIASSRNMHSIVKRLLEMYDSEVARASSTRVPSQGCAAEQPTASSCLEEASMGECQRFLGKDSFYPAFYEGDVVQVKADLEVVCSLQSGHEKWSTDMEKTLGRIGRVSKINSKGNVEVIIDKEESDRHETFAYRPNALIFISRQEPTDRVPLVYPEAEELPAEDENEPYFERVEGTADALLIGAVTCHLTKIRKILEIKPELVDHRSRGFTALHLACHGGLSSVVKLLLDKGSNSELPNQAGLFPLHLSAAYDKSGLSASLLLDRKANVDVVAENHHLTALHFAVLSNNEEATKVLIEHKCNPNIKDCQGNTPMHYAINQDKDALMLAILGSSTFDPLSQNNSGSNTLHEAVESSNDFALKKLIERYPMYVNKPNSSGLTVVHLAVLSNLREAVQLLLKTETVDIDALTKANETPLQLAMSKKFEGMADLLLERGATFREAQLVPTPQECLASPSLSDSPRTGRRTDPHGAGRKKPASARGWRSTEQITDISVGANRSTKKKSNPVSRTPVGLGSVSSSSPPCERSLLNSTDKHSIIISTFVEAQSNDSIQEEDDKSDSLLRSKDGKDSWKSQVPCDPPKTALRGEEEERVDEKMADAVVELDKSPGNRGLFDYESFSNERGKEAHSGEKTDPPEVEQSSVDLTARKEDSGESLNNDAMGTPQEQEKEQQNVTDETKASTEGSLLSKAPGVEAITSHEMPGNGLDHILE